MDEIFEVTSLMLGEDEDGNAVVYVGLSNDNIGDESTFTVDLDDAKKYQLGRRFRVRVSRSTK